MKKDGIKLEFLQDITPAINTPQTVQTNVEKTLRAISVHGKIITSTIDEFYFTYLLV